MSNLSVSPSPTTIRTHHVQPQYKPAPSAFNLAIFLKVSLLLGLGYLALAVMGREKTVSGLRGLAPAIVPPLRPPVIESRLLELSSQNGSSQQLVYALPHSISPVISLSASNDHLLIRGYTYSSTSTSTGPFTPREDELFLRLDPSGNLRGTQLLRLDDRSLIRSAYSILDNEGNTYTLQSDGSGDVPGNILIYKTDGNSQILWAKNPSVKGYVSSAVPIISQDGNLIVSYGANKFDSYEVLAKFDADTGSLLRETVYLTDTATFDIAEFPQGIVLRTRGAGY